MRLATRMAVLSKFLDKQVTVLDGLKIGEPKTKVVAGMLKALGLGETSCQLVIEEQDANICKYSMNIANLQVSSDGGFNAYDLLHQRQMIVTKSALDRLRAAKAKS
jgi:large subunit ribosomal protein L4